MVINQYWKNFMINQFARRQNSPQSVLLSSAKKQYVA